MTFDLYTRNMLVEPDTIREVQCSRSLVKVQGHRREFVRFSTAHARYTWRDKMRGRLKL